MQTCTVTFSATSVDLQAGSESGDDEMDDEEEDDDEDDDEDEEDQPPSKKTKVDNPALLCQTCMPVCLHHRVRIQHTSAQSTLHLLFEGHRSTPHPQLTVPMT